jgi:GPH family glycoside/pentoside/hexuronide:cation symporter
MSSDGRQTTTASDRISWHQLIAYGFGGLIPIALFNIAGQLIGLLGNISLGLSAFWLGTIMIFPRLWEALSDPVIGHFSDNTRSQWGRRRPYILIGGIAVALSFVAMWWVPRGEWIHEVFTTEQAYNWFQLAFILGGLLVFFTSCAVFEIPHGALGLEMSLDPHERTRLFSAKSFLGNLFAMGTPWLILLANLEFFRGTGGDLVDGMRYVTIFIAVILIPMSVWWFVSLREPGFAIAKEQKKSEFWHDVQTTLSNRTFLILTAAIFTLAMGFNFVGIFANYITIFYLYGGDVGPASLLLGITGTVWAVTALLAVFPLNWTSKRIGKRNTLLIAILLMCAAQISKIFCYRPGVLFKLDLPEWLASETNRTFTFQGPYLILLPTMLLSAGMLMFFTLGSSMVGDVCDEDELNTGTRSEGMYYSVFWWFIKMGTAFASFVMGALLVFTGFDEKQNVTVGALRGNIEVIKSHTEDAELSDLPLKDRLKTLGDEISAGIKNAMKVKDHFAELARLPEADAERLGHMVRQSESVLAALQSVQVSTDELVANPAQLAETADALQEQTIPLVQQTPQTLFRMRLVEIGVPLALSCLSILLTLMYPLTESRCYEIKAALEKRRGELSA